MTRTPRILLALLVLQATLMAALWSRRTGEEVPPPELFLLGTRYEAIAIGAGQTLDPVDSAGEAWTLVMAFSASCQWCDSVAPAWEALTIARRPGLRLVGVTQDDSAVAAGYAAAHRWRFDTLLAGADPDPGSPGGQLTARTPWFYLFDSRGTLRRSGHGASAGVAVHELHPSLLPEELPQ
jgi:hypothetical protein